MDKLLYIFLIIILVAGIAYIILAIHHLHDVADSRLKLINKITESNLSYKQISKLLNIIDESRDDVYTFNVYKSRKNHKKIISTINSYFILNDSDYES